MDRFDERIGTWLQQYSCDLLVLGFGMNDGSKTADELVERLRVAVDRSLEICPKLSVLTVATMLPNPEAARHWFRNQKSFESAMLEMAGAYAAQGIPVAVVPMTSMSRWVLSRKRFRDYSGNNINHPNDFMIRLYAQTLLQTLIGLDEDDRCYD